MPTQTVAKGGRKDFITSNLVAALGRCQLIITDSVFRRIEANFFKIYMKPKKKFPKPGTNNDLNEISLLDYFRTYEVYCNKYFLN